MSKPPENPPTFRFVRLPYSVQDDDSLGPLEVAVFLAIARHADAEGVAYPGIECISAISHVGRTRVSRSIERLRDRGHITIERGRRAGNRRAVNQYLVLAFSSLDSRGERTPDERTNGERSQTPIRERSPGGLELDTKRTRKNPSDSLREESEKRDEESESNAPTSTLFPDLSPPSSARPPLPAEPRPRQGRGNTVPPELLPTYHEVESRLRGEAEARGITWRFGKEGRGLVALAKAYATKPAELGPLVETWLTLTASQDRFYGGKPPTASMLLSLLSPVEAEHRKRKPRPVLASFALAQFAAPNSRRAASPAPHAKCSPRTLAIRRPCKAAKLRQGATV